MARSVVAPSVQPRVFPAGRALLLLAIGASQMAGRRFSIEGRRVQAVRFGRLALAIGYVDAAQFGPEELARNREQVAWLRTEARLHERAVERAAVLGPVLPARLLSVHPTLGALEAYAKEQYARWSRALTRLGTRREYAVHLFRGPHAPPGSESYLFRVSARATRGGRAAVPRVDSPVAEELSKLQRACSEGPSATRRVAADGRRGELFASALLLDQAQSASLKTTLQGLSTAGGALGLTYYLEGPRAPFSFF
jgi:hypothetical protein